MMRIGEATIDPAAIHAALPGYMDEVAEHCPYVGASMAQGLMTWSAFSVGTSWEAFAAVSAAVEATRVRCRAQGELACSNVVFPGLRSYEDAQRLLGMPHWIAQHVYAPVQIMLGAFFIGCGGVDRRGLYLSGAPVSFITVRRCQPALDRALMSAGTDRPDASHLVSDVADDGRDVLAGLLGKPGDARSDFAKLIRAFPLPSSSMARGYGKDQNSSKGGDFPLMAKDYSTPIAFADKDPETEDEMAKTEEDNPE